MAKRPNVRTYPNITPSTAKALEELATAFREWPDFFSHGDLNYPPEVTQSLKDILDTATGGHIDIAAESKLLYRQIKQTLENVGNMEVSEKVQLFRTATALQEKLLAINEKAQSLEHYGEFKAMVVRMMERFLTPVQLSEFTEAMAELAKTKV